MKTITFLVLTMIFATITTFSQTMPPIETGVSQNLAQWREKRYSDVRYKLNLTLEKMSPILKGTMEIRVKLSEPPASAGGEHAPPVILDWRKIRGKEDLSTVSNVSINNQPLTLAANAGGSDTSAKFEEVNEHLVFKDGVIKGENVIKFDFTSPIATSGAAITRYVDKEDGAEYIYSLFVPSDASTAFPVFDQPDLKARFQLEITSPKEWKAVSNSITTKHFTRLVGLSTTFEISEPTSKQIEHKKIYFAETKPISTYVFAFAAGDFAEFDECKYEPRPLKCVPTLTGKEFQLNRQSFIYVRKSQAEKFKQHAAEVFRLNREAVKYLESYFDYKFPFPKYDLVLLPEFPFGGMEHAGATFLREDRVIFPTEPTKNDYITRANVIFHEAAHQWFGDTVTMRWFDDLWLKEGFAEFMAYKTLEKVMPEYNAWKIFYERNKQAAYLTDSTKGTTPIYQEIPNLSAAKSAYGNIVYRKAPSFLRQAEFYLGEDEFQIAVRQFLKKHEFANAEWTDLVKEFELASKQDLKDWAEKWVKQRGMPVIRTLREEPKHGASYFTVQNDILGNKGYWKTKFKVFTIDVLGKKSVNETEFFYQENYSSSLKGFLPTEAIGATDQFKFIFPNYQDYGYGIFLLDEKSRAYVLANIQTEKDDFLRTMMWGALWDSVRETELNPKDYVELVIKNLSVESDESTIQTLLGRVSTAMNYYLSDAQSKALAPRIENALLNGMAKAETVGQKITFYRAYLNIASTDKAKKLLKDILENNGKMSIAVDVGSESGAIRPMDVVLPLKTKDKFDIVTKLLILGDVSAPNMLAELEKTETSDEAKRYAYAAKAGIGTAENKAKFWNDFTNNKEISESYIESAFVAFNSSKHADLTLIYLEKSLAELPNLKRNRKIFFVNGWLAAFIGGQKSVEALAIVNKFLADNPNLDRDLRLKVLENVDGLERAVKIRAKYEK